MLAAISTTTLSRRSCALTGSAITSRRRRNSTRGPPSAPRIDEVLTGPEGPILQKTAAGTRSRPRSSAYAKCPCKGQAKGGVSVAPVSGETAGSLRYQLQERVRVAVAELGHV